jgi:hypothetical protein
MKIRDLYQEFEIMPQLETHMLRVAGVGQMVAKNWAVPCDTEFITNLCLVHDLGNIVKFDLSEKFNQNKFGMIENIGKWREVQKKYIQKYGENAQTATINILTEAKLEQYVEPLIKEEELYFAEAVPTELDQANLASVILMYADCRVTPGGVCSYRERIDDLRERYGGVKTETWYDWTYSFEKWMQENTKIDLNSITEEAVKPLFDELLTRTI